MNREKILELSEKTQDIYERNSLQFDHDRTKTLFEKKWLERFVALLPDNPKILDIGCGSGEPIARYFIEKDISITGVDFSKSLLDIAKSRFPNNPWHYQDMRDLAFDEKYDGIIAWHSFFHLTPDDQPKTLEKFSDHLLPNGVLMLTVGSEEGLAIGHIGNDKVYHASLSTEEYKTLLDRLGIQIIEFMIDDIECGRANIILAQKNG